VESDIDSGMMAVDREDRVEELLPADHPPREAPHALRGEWLDPVVNPSVHG